MSQELSKVLNYENDLHSILKGNTNLDVETVISKLEKILPKLKNDEILYLLKNCSYIHNFIDVCSYLKKYRINKTELKKDNNYQEEFKKLNNFIKIISDVSIDEQEYMFICNKCLVDETASYLLSKMTNNQIMELSNESNDWNYKLFLYGNLKQ